MSVRKEQADEDRQRRDLSKMKLVAHTNQPRKNGAGGFETLAVVIQGDVAVKSG